MQIFTKIGLIDELLESHRVSLLSIQAILLDSIAKLVANF